MSKILVIGLLLSLAPQLGAVRQHKFQSVEADGQEGPDVCCCRIHTKGPEKCSGNSPSGRRYLYDAVTASRTGPRDAKSHTCYEKDLCCHTFKGSCQMKDPFGFKERYSIANVDPRLCTALPEVAESLFTATPQDIFGENAFLDALKKKPNEFKKGLMSRDYTIIVDRSGSMSASEQVRVPSGGVKNMQRWEQVRMALDMIAPLVIEEDPDGITVFFFDNGFDEHENVRTVRDVDQLFRENSPGGRTFLAKALSKAMEPDTIGRAETIFVITDGEASDPDEVTRAIIDYTSKLCRPEMLSISFIQVGNDPGAGEYLNSLDNDLEKKNAKFDIVDALTAEEMHGKSFLEIVAASVFD